MASIAEYTGVLGHRHACHLLRRATYKFTKERVDDFAGKTPETAIDELFVIPSPNVPEPIDLETLEHYINLGVEPVSPELRLKVFIGAWWLEEALNNGSISHKLEFFLHSIFVTHIETGQSRQNYDYLNLLRLTSSSYTNGSFDMDSYKSLALKMISDNVMLQYLNGNQNTKDNPNENFAREFFELFTIGKGPQVGPGDYTNYTEDDIVAAAKVLTGWNDTNRPLGQGGDPNYTDSETGIQRGDARPFHHDDTDKTFSSAFNNTIINGATTESEMWDELNDFVDMIFAQNETAKNIARKLYRYFVGRKITQEIEDDIITPLANTLFNNNYKLSKAIKQLLKSEHFYDLDDSDATNEIIGSIIKSPIEKLMQTMSFFELKTPHYLDDADNHYNRWYQLTVKDVITEMAGMTVFYPDSVAGYPAYYQEPGYSRNWFNGSTLIARYKQPEILLTGNRVLADGDNGGVQLDIVDFVNTSEVFTDPKNAETLVNDFLYYLLPELAVTERASYFLNEFLDGLSPINWQFEWANYVATGDNSAVKIPLETFFKLVISSQEYELM